MPRTSRSVAQRLASQQSKSKKRRSPRTAPPAQEASSTQLQASTSSSSPSSSSPTMAEILDEVVPSEGGSRAASMSALAPAAPSTENRAPTPTRPAARRATGRTAGRPAAPRRRYHEYAAEYAYVWADLQRILVVAGVLIVLLIVLSFYLQ